MSDRTRPRRGLRRVLAAVSGGVLVALAAGVVIGAEQLPTDDVTVPATSVEVPPTTTAQVCPGPPRLATAVAGEDLGYDEFDPAGSGTTTLLSALSVPTTAGAPGPASLGDLAGDQGAELGYSGAARLGQETDVAGARVLSAEPAGGRAALASGTSMAATATGDLRSLVATACQPPTTGSWLVGGSTEPGSSAQLVLTNVGDTPASVTLHGWGSTGPVDLSAAGTVLVPPQDQRVVLLEAIAPGLERLAVRTEVTGGEVTAVLQDSRLRGLVPAGTDLVAPAAPAAETAIVPGVVLGESAAGDPDPPVVRIVNPGQTAVSATLDFLGPEGPEPVPGAADLVVDPGVAVDVSLAGLPAGAWSARVVADGPVVASAMLTAVGEPGEVDSDVPPVDRAWARSTEPLSTGLVAVPGLGELVSEAQLVLTNPSADEVAVTVHPVLTDGAAAEPVTVTLAPRTAAVRDLAALAQGPVAAVELQAAAPVVHAAVHLSGTASDGALLSVLAVPQDPHAARSVDLAPARPALR